MRWNALCCAVLCWLAGGGVTICIYVVLIYTLSDCSACGNSTVVVLLYLDRIAHHPDSIHSYLCCILSVNPNLRISTQVLDHYKFSSTRNFNCITHRSLSYNPGRVPRSIRGLGVRIYQLPCIIAYTSFLLIHTSFPGVPKPAASKFSYTQPHRS